MSLLLPPPNSIAYENTNWFAHANFRPIKWNYFSPVNLLFLAHLHMLEKTVLGIGHQKKAASSSSSSSLWFDGTMLTSYIPQEEVMNIIGVVQPLHILYFPD